MRIPTLTLFIGDILICELPERLNLEKAHRVDHLVVSGYKVKVIYGYILHTPYSMLLPKRCERKECVLNILFTQLFEHGKGKLITCMAQTLIHVINAIIDPTKVHFEGCSIHPTSSLLQMEALANWWITMVACFFHDIFHREPPWLRI